jgi:hypothetical protein
MPYGYYQFVRLAATIIFTILGLDALKRQSQIEMVVWFGLALLFQPLIKIAMGREVWNVLDIIIGIGLVVHVLLRKKDG